MDTPPPAAEAPPPRAAHVVRRVLLRHGIHVDPDTAQAVADALQALPATPGTAPPRVRWRRAPRPVPEAATLF